MPIDIKRWPEQRWPTIRYSDARYPDDRWGNVQPPSLNFIIEVDTTQAGSASDTFIMPLAGSGYDATIFWGDGTNTPISVSPGNVAHVYGAPGTYIVTVVNNVPGGFPRIFFNNGGDKEKVLDIRNWGTGEWSNMQAAFRGCSNLTTVSAIDIPDLTNVALLTSMFNMCTSMTSLNVSTWDVSPIDNMASTFQECPALITLDVSSWDVTSVTSMNSMFKDCTVLTLLGVGDWRPDSVLTTASMFNNCAALVTIDLSAWTSALNLTTTGMFAGCALLETVLAANLDTSALTDVSNMFLDCASLDTLDLSLMDTSNITTMVNLFRNCPLLDIDVSGFDVTSLVTAGGMFNGSGFSQINYDLMLVAWAPQAVLDNVDVHAGTAQYAGGGPAAGKAELEGDHNWTFIDGGQTTSNIVINGNPIVISPGNNIVI